MKRYLYGATHNNFPHLPLDWAKCGTAANYRAHHRRGETPCDACKQAEARRKCDMRRQAGKPS